MQTDFQQQELRLDDFILKRSKRKTLAIYVTPSGVEVRAPYYSSLKEIREFLESKALWILNHQTKLIEQESQKPKIKNGEYILYRGTETQINIAHSSKNAITQQGNKLLIQSKSLENEQLIKQVENWLHQQGKNYLPQRTRYLAECYDLSEKLCRISLRKTKTKWGHCTHQGAIQLNWLLMMAPVEISDYVITHELCHLIHLNHSKHYWQMLETLMPDYKQRQIWLKENGHLMHFC